MAGELGTGEPLACGEAAPSGECVAIGYSMGGDVYVECRSVACGRGDAAARVALRVGLGVGCNVGGAVGTGVGSGVTRGSGKAGSVATLITWRCFHEKLLGLSDAPGDGVATGSGVADKIETRPAT